MIEYLSASFIAMCSILNSSLSSYTFPSLRTVWSCLTNNLTTFISSLFDVVDSLVISIFTSPTLLKFEASMKNISNINTTSITGVRLILVIWLL